MDSKLRQLIMKLEYVDTLMLAHPFIKGFEQTYHCLNDVEVHQCAEGNPTEAVIHRKKADIEGKEGSNTIFTTMYYIGLAVEPKRRTLTNNSSQILYGILAKTHVVQSWFCRTEKAGYLVSHDRVHEDGENLGEI